MRLVTIWEACAILGVRPSTFYRSYRKKLKPKGKRTGSKAWMFDERAVRKLRPSWV